MPYVMPSHAIPCVDLLYLTVILRGRAGYELIYIAISKNVVRENDECQLSNGDCTTEKKCGY